MNLDKWIASPVARIAAAASAALSAGAFAAANAGATGGLKTFLTLLGVAFALLTVLGFIISFHGTYWRWMKFAAALQKVMVTILFGVCYLLIVPLFSILLRNADPLKLRTSPDRTGSLWRARKPDETDPDSYLRMG